MNLDINSNFWSPRGTALGVHLGECRRHALVGLDTGRRGEMPLR